MKYLAILTMFAMACTDVPGSGPRHGSVSERLAGAPTSLYVHDEASTGSVTARRRGYGGWIDGTSQLTLEHGHVRAAIDDRGQLVIDQLDIAVAPIVLDGVFQKPAALHGVRLRLVESARSAATWATADDATATLSMELDLDWSIVLDGGEPYPLATQHLPTMTVDVVLAGSGDHIDARIDLAAEGELWSWADIVQITELTLSLDAQTAD
jgi:hypothetical protein